MRSTHKIGLINKPVCAEQQITFRNRFFSLNTNDDYRYSIVIDPIKPTDMASNWARLAFNLILIPFSTDKGVFLLNTSSVGSNNKAAEPV
ncbi:hypothetical protein TNCV_1076501 [Trichonephila clavipes]|uniref:Uncharacterized protein n=1 Tax=Trichonephila clavipes TaxID=2585209 RepID=A0A8X6RR81_TRICX|nr:hypothetical protein TNCV_1076501 [Trichonephila clavipes]